MTAPREFAERFFNIVRWTELPVGGHFTAWEEPEAFARELTALAREVASSEPWLIVTDPQDHQVLTTIAIENYRSLRDLRLPLEQLNVITGANGTGKSSLYRALRLLADCASGRVISSVAREGGLESVLWAGPEHLGAAVRSGRHPVQGTVRSGPISLQLGFASDDFSYLIDLGLPIADDRRRSTWIPRSNVKWSGAGR